MEEIAAAISAFLEGSDHHGLLIRGDWGTGKTYLTTKALREWEAIEPKKRSWLNVSLYGRRAIRDIDLAIAASVAARKLKGLPVAKEHRHLEAALRATTSEGLIGHIAREVARSSVLLFDDLERKGADLGLPEVIGYLDNLINTYGAKIVCIANTDQLSPEERAWLQANAEKTFSRRFRLTPSSDHVVGVVSSSKAAEDSEAVSFIRTIGVTNIRIASEIVAACRDFRATIGVQNTAALKQAISDRLATVCVGTAAYAGLADFLTPEFLSDQMAHFRMDQGNPEHAGWTSLLRKAHYMHTDEFDLEVLRQIERGYFSKTTILEKFQDVKQEQSDALHLAWREYHDSVDGDTEAFVNRFVAAARASFRVTSLSNMNASVKLLRMLNRRDMAEAITREYAAARMDMAPSALDVPRDHFIDANELDPEFGAAMAVALQQRIESLDLAATIEASAAADSITNYQALRLSLATPEELAEALTKLSNSLRETAIKLYLEPGRYNLEVHQVLSSNVRRALKIIAGDSLLNRVRMLRKFRVNVDEV